jgi:hypothetical protein
LGVVGLVGWADPDPVAGAHVPVVRQQLDDRAAGMAGVAAVAAALGFVAQREPVGLRVAQFDQRAGQPGVGLVGDLGE